MPQDYQRCGEDRQCRQKHRLRGDKGRSPRGPKNGSPHHNPRLRPASLAVHPADSQDRALVNLRPKVQPQRGRKGLDPFQAGFAINAENIAKALGGRKTGSAWMAKCPAHDDRSPSLSIRHADDGKVLVLGGSPAALASAEVYDPATGTWTSTGSMHA